MGGLANRRTSLHRIEGVGLNGMSVAEHGEMSPR